MTPAIIDMTVERAKQKLMDSIYDKSNRDLFPKTRGGKALAASRCVATSIGRRRRKRDFGGTAPKRNYQQLATPTGKGPL